MRFCTSYFPSNKLSILVCFSCVFSHIWTATEVGSGGRKFWVCFSKRQNGKYSHHSVYTNKSTAPHCLCCYFVVISVILLLLLLLSDPQGCRRCHFPIFRHCYPRPALMPCNPFATFVQSLRSQRICGKPDDRDFWSPKHFCIISRWLKPI